MFLLFKVTNLEKVYEMLLAERVSKTFTNQYAFQL